MLSGGTDPASLISTFSNWTNSFWGMQGKFKRTLKKFPTTTLSKKNNLNPNFFIGSDFGGNCFYDTSCLRDDPSKWQPTSRAWRWQKCSELAYFQVAPSSRSLRSTIYENFDYVVSQCREIFGSSVLDTDKTNQYYGMWRAKGKGRGEARGQGGRASQYMKEGKEKGEEMHPTKILPSVFTLRLTLFRRSEHPRQQYFFFGLFG
jgi:hypothetical protein